jgi:hypothetical protein
MVPTWSLRTFFFASPLYSRNYLYRRMIPFTSRTLFLYPIPDILLYCILILSRACIDTPIPLQIWPPDNPLLENNKNYNAKLVLFLPSPRHSHNSPPPAVLTTPSFLHHLFLFSLVMLFLLILLLLQISSSTPYF